MQHAGVAIGPLHEHLIVPASVIEALCALTLSWGAAAVLNNPERPGEQRSSEIWLHYWRCDTVVTRRAAYFVDYGLYRWVRNPMYTGILLLGMSLGLALGTWLLPIAASLAFTLLALRTRTEERYLIERFGDQYRGYMQRVGRFFPKRPS